MTVARLARTVTPAPVARMPMPLPSDAVFSTVRPIGAPPGGVVATMPSWLLRCAGLFSIRRGAGLR